MPNLEAVTSQLQRPDNWSAENAHCCARYQILVEAEADSLCRVLNLFAMQYLIPHQVNVLQQDEVLCIEVEVRGLTWHRAQVIAEKMRSLINVCSVELEQLAQPHVSNPTVSLAVG
jgi:acetolactate synthase small subunit